MTEPSISLVLFDFLYYSINEYKRHLKGRQNNMKYYDWNEEKNQILKEKRKICFEEIIWAIEHNQLLDIVQNSKYAHQKIFVVGIDQYVYLVPFIEDDEKYFLKTIYPSRVATKKYLK
jgi:hypothetical protein